MEPTSNDKVAAGSPWRGTTRSTRALSPTLVSTEERLNAVVRTVSEPDNSAAKSMKIGQGEHSQLDTSARELQGQILEGVKMIPQEQTSKRIVKQTVDVAVPQVM